MSNGELMKHLMVIDSRNYISSTKF